MRGLRAYVESFLRFGTIKKLQKLQKTRIVRRKFET